ncbi:MAG: sensor histidine kinase [Nitrospirae bacterium]|nr:sensor histidine kinase [Nitrospirota bacterium]
MEALNFIQEWSGNNLDIIFFVYGLGFLVMGITIIVHPKKGSEFRIADSIWLLAAFGLSHGLNEHLDMFAIIKGRHPSLDIVRWFVLVISYIFLFEFGRRLLILVSANSNAAGKRASRLFGWWTTPLIVAVILFKAFSSSDFWLTGSIWTRYLLGFSGSYLIGSCLYYYFAHNEDILRPLHLKKYFFIFSIAFYIYGILGGLIVPKADFFPASLFNNESFHKTFHIPVQAFRALCALAASWAIGGILQIFNWEMRKKLEVSRNQLRRMISRLSKVEDEERRRIAEDLHDHIGQNLAISKIRLKMLKDASHLPAEEIQNILSLIDEAISYTRSLTFEISPQVLHQLGLIPAIVWLADLFRKKHGLMVKVTAEGNLENIRHEESIFLFKAVRELLHNVVKHADAAETKIIIESGEKDITVAVQDDGIGFDTRLIADLGKESSEFGILNIQERASQLGGSVVITSAKGAGTRAVIKVPAG